MCRLMAYLGPPVLVADVVLWPDRSIIKQSYDARERKMDANLPSHLAYGNLNGDGFGIGWYTESTSQSAQARAWGHRHDALRVHLHHPSMVSSSAYPGRQ